MNHNILVVIGSAPCVKEDLARIPVLERCDLMAVGLDAVDRCRLPIMYVSTNHPEDIPGIRERRAAAGGNMDFLIIGPLPGLNVDIVEPYRPPSGSSAITGTLAAIRMGYDRIVLAGCPLIGNAPEGNPYEAFRPGWESKKEELLGKVKSMSGWTRELLGGPEEWFEERMDVPVSLVLSGLGKLIIGDETYRAYSDYVSGREKEGRDRLIRAHYESYFSERLNVTTDGIVREVYESRGIEKPEEYMDSDPAIVREAVERRVDNYIAALDDYRRDGYKETDPVRMAVQGKHFIMRSCGYNKVAALAALGYEYMPNVVIVE